MSLASKHYYLFGWRVWSVIVEMHAEDVEVDDETDEDEPEGVAPLSASTTIDGGGLVPFGFTPFTPHWITEEDE